jgi:hypothetical protein
MATKVAPTKVDLNPRFSPTAADRREHEIVNQRCLFQMCFSTVVVAAVGPAGVGTASG